MTKEEIEELKQKIKDGWAMAHDPACSAGFDAADTLIKYYEGESIYYKAAIDNYINIVKSYKRDG